MKLGLNFLSEDEKHRIHKDSINILSRVGVKFISNKALKILEKNGASVNYDTRIAKMPEEMPLANVVWPNVMYSDMTDNYNEIRLSVVSLRVF